jgi:hypothetical protein
MVSKIKSSFLMILFLAGCSSSLTANLHQETQDELTAPESVALIKEAGERTVELQWATLFTGDEAIDMAVLETECKPLEIHDCAPTLSENYYLSTTGAALQRYALASQTPVLFLNENQKQLEKKWESLWDAKILTDLIQRGAVFKVTLEKGAVVNLEEISLVSR